jgi:hypothetical protein
VRDGDVRPWRGLTRVLPWPQIRIHDQHEPGDLQSATSATPGRERDPRTYTGPAGWCRNATGCASLTDVLAIEPCWRAGWPSRQSTMAVDAAQNETSYPASLRPCRDGSRSPRYCCYVSVWRVPVKTGHVWRWLLQVWDIQQSHGNIIGGIIGGFVYASRRSTGRVIELGGCVLKRHLLLVELLQADETKVSWLA